MTIKVRELDEEGRPISFFLWTVFLPRWRVLKRAGMRMLDITVKSGNPAFAPHPWDLSAYKKGQMGEIEYRERYIEKMLESVDENREAWDRLSTYTYVAIGCYCKAGEFCHRHIFKGMAQTHLETMGWGVKQMGEWTEANRDDPNLILPQVLIDQFPA